MRSIRVCVTQVSQAIEIKEKEDGAVTLSGPGGSQAEHYFKSIFKNVSWVVTPEDEEMGTDIGNGSYNGLLGFLEQNKCDVNFFPQPLGLHPKLDSSPVVYETDGAILQIPEVKSEPIQLVETLNIFPIEVYLVILLITFFLSLALIIKRGQAFGHLIDCFEHSFACYIDQANMEAIAFGNQRLISLFLLFAFVLMQYYEQSMNADLVAKDFSQVLMSMEDIDRFKQLNVRLLKSDPHIAYYRTSSDPVFVRLFERKLTYFEDTQTLFLNPSKFINKENTVIAYDGLITILGNSMCHKDKSKQWRISNSAGKVKQAYSMSPYLDARIKSEIKFRIMRAADVGVTEGSKAGVKRIGSQFLGSSDSCECVRLDDLFEEEDLKPITIRSTATFFVVFLVLLKLALVTFILQAVF